jgi:hypothetical protein
MNETAILLMIAMIGDRLNKGFSLGEAFFDVAINYLDEREDFNKAATPVYSQDRMGEIDHRGSTLKEFFNVRSMIAKVANSNELPLSDFIQVDQYTFVHHRIITKIKQFAEGLSIEDEDGQSYLLKGDLASNAIKILGLLGEP